MSVNVHDEDTNWYSQQENTSNKQKSISNTNNMDESPIHEETIPYSKAKCYVIPLKTFQKSHRKSRKELTGQKGEPDKGT